MKTYLKRAYHYFYALTHGYFWEPCTICGKYFGGHEPSATLMESWSTSTTVCKACEPIAKARNKAFIESLKKIPRYYSA